MKFHEHPAFLDFSEEIEPCLKNLIVAMQVKHLNEGMPFYNVYPSVCECLKNTKLDVSLWEIQGTGESVAACFAHGSEPAFDGTKVSSMLLWPTSKNDDGLAVLAKTNRGWHVGSYSAKCKNRLMETALAKGIVKIAFGICLLASDERFCEPILLNRDTNRVHTPESYQAAVDRAKRRGRNGFTIGKNLEISPHVRRPHFAIRWTGNGKNTPRLVPVSGCVVSRSKLFPIPTGYRLKKNSGASNE